MRPRYPPIFFVTLLFATGVFLADRQRFAMGVVLAIMAFVLSLLLVHLRRPFALGAALPYALFFLTGVLAASLHISHIEAGPLLMAAQRGGPAVVEGMVAKEPVTAENGTTIELAVGKVTTGGKTYATQENARVLCSSLSMGVEAGDLLAVYGHPGPPGGSDPGWRRYFFHKGTVAQLSATPGRLEIIKKQASPVKRIVNEIRGRLKKTASASLKPGTAGLLVGVILGDTRGIDPGTQEDFRATGLTHALAVSGLNIMFFVGALWPLLKLTRLPPVVQFAVLSVAIWLYALLAEGSPSVLRAAAMAEMLVFAWLTGRARDPVATVSVAGLVLLVVDPFYLFDIGFQLSFCATFGLVVLSPVLAEKFEGMPPFLVSSVSTCLAAQVGVLPLLVAYFGQLSLVSLPANLIVIPASAPALVLGILATALDFFAPWGSLVCYRIAGLFTDFMMVGAHFFASLPAASLVLPEVGWQTVAVLYGSLIFAAVLVSRWRGRLTLFHLLLVLLVPATAGAAWQVVSSRPPSGVEITFLDVGQGDATLVREPRGSTVLIDSGPDESVLQGRLTARGVKKIDLAFLTHQHADHSAGFRSVFRTMAVGRFVVPQAGRRTSDLTKLIEEAESGKASVEEAVPGREYRLGDVSVRVVSTGAAGGNENDVSTVVKVEVGEFSLLVPGDSEEEEERSLVEGGGLSASVLKVPHHGGATAAYPGFLSAVGPKVAVISVGKGNRYGLPSKTAVDRLRAAGASIYRTDRNGSVRILTDGKSMEVTADR
ncbi:MAG: DNA internalization-related competence protein ComEC/Rec2 [Chloroflexi bacterium]|nr:DNA internalization-related competence protein ComEC/Rec2 [Chloroflexota bacterium]